MNAAQRELVRTTFAALAVMPEVAGALFYEKLFTANPSFQPLFKNDMRIQGVKLIDYDAMRDALLWTLEQALGEGFTPAVRGAWSVCYDELADEMKAAVGV